MKPTNTVAKLFSFVSTLAVVAGAMALNGMAWGQASVLAWGANDNGPCTIPDSATSGISAIAGGEQHSIALKSGVVLAWGYNAQGQCNIPAAANSGVTAIAGGYYHTIAIKSGVVLAWGSNVYGQCAVPSSAMSGVSAIDCGWWHSIALKDGAVLAWGDNEDGQCLGTNASGSPITSVPTGAPVQLMGQTLIGVNAIASGYIHTVALKSGSVLAWGSNYYGQCTIPASASSGVTDIASGDVHTIALKEGSVIAWGDNVSGQCLGTNASGSPITSVPTGAPVVIMGQVLTGVTAIAGGRFHTVALKNGSVLAWGRNDEGQCSVPASATSNVIRISTGGYYTIALKSHETITGVLPISGPSSGNTNIPITGTNFESPATVTIGGAPATNIVLVSDTQITATTPAGFPGPAVVTVNLGSSTAFYYRPTCGADLDNNYVVDSADLGYLLLEYGNCSSESATATETVEPVRVPMVEQSKPITAKK